MKTLCGIALTLGMAAPLWSQTPLAFEAASIKQEDITLPNRVTGGACHGSEARGEVGIPGMTIALGRCRYVGAKVKQLINNAYGGVAFDRIIGGPGWIESLPFSIDAKAEEGTAPTRAQLMEMMRTLLEDRFKLKFHREMKEVSGYTLVVGKNGIKLKESAEGTRAGVVNRPGSITGSMPIAMLAGDMTSTSSGAPMSVRLKELPRPQQLPQSQQELPYSLQFRNLAYGSNRKKPRLSCSLSIQLKSPLPTESCP